MSETTTVSIDLSPIIRAVNSLDSKINSVRIDIEQTQETVEATREDLAVLQKEFTKFVKEQRNAAALQRALTEIVRIRQELDMKFGRHEEVRTTMLGILDVSGSQTVKTDTIIQRSEELKLACAKYWLAPCVIAIAAWIGDNKTVADKALSEALVRNEEYTSLVMALISRRAGRVETSFVWLKKYFDMQDPKNMKESILAYIDGYANGIFGEDKDNICRESVNGWLKKLESENAGFRQTQISRWKGNYNHVKEKPLNGVAALSAEGVCEEYAEIYDLVARIRSREKICRIFDNILTKQVNRKGLIEEIDENLKTLVKDYEEEEAPLRKEEREMTLIKKYNGDMDKVDAELSLEAPKKDGPVDLGEILSDAIVRRDTKPSIRKTSVKLMTPYLKQAYKEYVNEKDEFYPQEITLNIGGCKMKTRNGENANDMKSAVTAKNQELCKKDLRKINMIPAIIFAVLALVGLIIAIATQDFLAVVGIVVLLVFAVLAILKFVKVGKKRKYIKAQYDKRLKDALNILQTALSERAALNNEVQAFREEPNRDVLDLEKEV